MMDADAEKTRDDAGAMEGTIRIGVDDDARASAVARAKHAGNHANGARRDDAARAREENPVGDVSARPPGAATLGRGPGCVAAPENIFERHVRVAATSRATEETRDDGNCAGEDIGERRAPPHPREAAEREGASRETATMSERTRSRSASMSYGEEREEIEQGAIGRGTRANERGDDEGTETAETRRRQPAAPPPPPPPPPMPVPVPPSIVTESNSTRMSHPFLMGVAQQQSHGPMHVETSMQMQMQMQMQMPVVWTNDDPSRTIYLVLADQTITDQMLWKIASQFGDIRALSSEMRRSMNAVFVAYYDIRCAEQAKRTLQQSTHVFHMVAYSSTCEWIAGMENQGRFLAYDVGIDEDAEREAELRKILEEYGELKRMMVPKGHEEHRFIEYYDVRHAELAVMELQRNGFRNAPLHVDLSWGHSQPQQQQSYHQLHSPTSISQYVGAPMMPNMYWPYGGGVPTIQVDAAQGYAYHGWPNEQYGYAMMDVGSGSSSHRSPRSSGEYTRSPRTSESMARSRSSQNSTVDGSSKVNQNEYVFNMEEANDKGATESARGRTTLMIRNIPNKYNQAMMLDLLNRSYAGQYDFFYLPIDFKNKCNLGYAFVNFKCTKQTAVFYKEFHKQRWKEFNSRKVCEVTYARVQGKEAMVDHFKNSRFPCENEEYLPLVFDTDGNKTSCHTLGHTAPRQSQQ